MQNTCPSILTRARCGQFDNDSKTCQNDMACVNCKGDYFAFSRGKVEKQVQHVKVEKHLSFYEARKFVDTSTPVSCKSYVSKLNSQTSVKSVWNKIHKIKEKESSNTIHHLSVNDRDVTSHHGIANALALRFLNT